ncbi:protein FAR1-RELATED SEQUENCE 6-like [Tasmannia lanceolata]|uniref:protein FAR1-RELATED SEQUENCE 6-like n=1 Tax=Tasmannia lanceolata TaxID=3420 RepID=UPI004063E5E7
MEEDTMEGNCDKTTPLMVDDFEGTSTVDFESSLGEDQGDGISTTSEMEEDIREENCEMFNSMDKDEPNESSPPRNFIAEGNADVVPVLGMEFESSEAAIVFYKNYAKSCGFRTKIRSSNCVGRSKELYHLMLACTKEGYKRMNVRTKNPRPSTREGCLAKMRIKKTMGSGKWVVTEVVTDHTHPVSPSEAHFERPHRQTSPCKKKRHRFRDLGAWTNQRMSMPSNQYGGLANVGDGEKDLVTSIDQQRQFAHGEGNASVVPVVGMEFDSAEAAHVFYTKYAKWSGFRTKIKSSHYYPNGSNDLYHLVISCTREGYKRINANTKNPRPVTREGCLAKMRIKKKMDSEKWVVAEVITEHTHVLRPLQVCFDTPYTQTPPDNTKSPLLYNDIGYHDIGVKGQQHIPSSSNQCQGVRGQQHVPTFSNQCQEVSNVGIGEKGIGNVIDQQRRLSLKEDARAIHDHFNRMQTKDPYFFYAVDISDDGHLKNIFWADANAKASYNYFGDVVIFNITHLTCHFDMLFATFMGVNHHGQSVSLGCGLVANKTKETYLWLFKAWLKAMSNRPPISIITDQCHSIQAAVAEAFPGARHCWCLWQILKEVPEKLAPLSRDTQFMKRFDNCINDSLRAEEFEIDWVKMIKDYELTENEWLNMLYEDRAQWVPVYLKDTFFAGMFTSQQSRSAVGFFDGRVHLKTTLNEFVEQYDLGVQRQCEKETKAEFDTQYMKLSLTTKSIFEKDAANVYTREVFLKFQDEISGLTTCTTKLIKEDGPVATYMVKESEEDDNGCIKYKEYEVIFNALETQVVCVCRTFEFHGYLCRHALLVLMNSDVYHIPSRYILARWRKDAKRHIPSHYILAHWSKDAKPAHLLTGPSDGYRMKRYDALCYLTKKFAEDGVFNEQTYEIALDVLDEAWNKVRQAAQMANSDQLCSVCKKPGHTRTTCKELPTQVIPSVCNQHGPGRLGTRDL